ncbi:MAG: N-acetylmuramoyl-L-alanine amidase [Bacteroidales bacterium]|nr:N-acetylmuramoyl-L-alanine amidase [Bacteroidales bacterium]
MRETTLDEIRDLVRMARPELERKAHAAGHDCVKIYLHWTAGWYDNCYDDYHINIMGAEDPMDDDDGRLMLATDDLAEVLEHTWRRNTGAIGIALCCCANATTNDLGDDCPPTDRQIEMMARVVCTICTELDLPINIKTVLTHGEAADNEDGDRAGYGNDECYGPKNGCERWDLEFLGTDESPEYNPYAEDGSRGGDVLRGKAIWYRQNGY